MKVNRLGLWLAVGSLVAACSSSSASNTGSASDGGGSDATGGSSSGGSSGSSSGGILGGSSSGGSSGSSGSSSGGSSGGGSGSGSGSSSGSGSGSSSGSSSGGSSGSSSGGPVDAGTDANCGSTPTLHQDPAGTIFCGYGAPDGGVLECLQSAGDDVCCLGGSLGGGTFAPEMCAATPAGCTNGGAGDAGTPAIPIACYQVADCTSAGFTGAVACCLQGATLPAMDPGCTYVRSKSGTGVTCEGTSPSDGGALSDAAAATTTGACGAGEVQLCSSQTDCPTGTTCTPGKWKIFQVGFCL